MRCSRFAAIGLAAAIGLGAPLPADAQTDDAAAAFVRVATGYSLTPNITYHRAGGGDLTLDVYRPRGATSPNPTLIYIHGGGWTNGARQASALTFLPYLEMGWSVVNVSYRLADAAHAPAAVEDCRCALRWVYRNAEQFNFDLDRIVVTGNSAGGHLSLTTGMLTEASAGLDRQCPGEPAPDLVHRYDLYRRAAGRRHHQLVRHHRRATTWPIGRRGPPGTFTEAWLGSRSDRDDVAKRVSPTNYVRRDLPPILTIHGDADPIVPYDHATRLHELLDAAGVPNELLTIEGGGAWRVQPRGRTSASTPRSARSSAPTGWERRRRTTDPSPLSRRGAGGRRGAGPRQPPYRPFETCSTDSRTSSRRTAMSTSASFLM